MLTLYLNFLACTDRIGTCIFKNTNLKEKDLYLASTSIDNPFQRQQVLATQDLLLVVANMAATVIIAICGRGATHRLPTLPAIAINENVFAPGLKFFVLRKDRSMP